MRYLKEAFGYIKNRYRDKTEKLGRPFEKIAMCSIIELLRELDSENKNNDVVELLFCYKAVIVRDNCPPKNEDKIFFTDDCKEYLNITPREQMCIFKEHKDSISVIEIIKAREGE